MITGSCHGCGWCCRAITVEVDFEKMQLEDKESRFSDKTDGRFILDNFTLITKEKAFEINPHLKTFQSTRKQSWFTCKNFDSDTNKCMIYDHRPQMCRNYPWYGESPSEFEAFYTPDCGYVIDRERIKVIRALQTYKENHKDYVKEVKEDLKWLKLADDSVMVENGLAGIQ